MSVSVKKFVWYDVMTTDTKAAEDFYRRVMGWDMKDSGMPDQRYTLLLVGQTMIGGLMPIPDDAFALGGQTIDWQIEEREREMAEERTEAVQAMHVANKTRKRQSSKSVRSIKTLATGGSIYEPKLRPRACTQPENMMPPLGSDCDGDKPPLPPMPGHEDHNKWDRAAEKAQKSTLSRRKIFLSIFGR